MDSFASIHSSLRFGVVDGARDLPRDEISLILRLQHVIFAFDYILPVLRSTHLWNSKLLGSAENSGYLLLILLLMSEQLQLLWCLCRFNHWM